MKKIVLIIFVIVTVLSINKNYNEQNMIRFRIIASSNQEEDQELKRKILKSIKKDLLSSSATTIEEEREYLKNKIPTFEEKIKKELPNNNYSIHYGLNYFPQKQYNGKTYKEGEYESLVITLGSGEGNNFWCILFPPLCMIDEEEIEYKSLIKEVLSNWF